MGKLAIGSAFLLLLLLAGCGSNPADQGSSTLTIQAAVGGFASTSNIDNVGLRVSGNDFDPILLDTAFVDGKAVFRLELPYGTDRLFEMWASSEGTVLFAGDTTANVIASAPTTVNVLLEPQVTMLRVAPAFREVELNVPETLEVMIHNVDSLFGVAFTLDYNPQIISIAYDTIAVKRGAFFDTSDIFFQHRDPAELGQRAIGLSLKGNGTAQGLSGSGTLVRLIYTGIAPGRTTIEFLDFVDHQPMMINWRGESLPRTGELYAEPGEVLVIE
ncbi:MAG: cohesin domain-containing protein [bacterium]